MKPEKLKHLKKNVEEKSKIKHFDYYLVTIITLYWQGPNHWVMSKLVVLSDCSRDFLTKLIK